MLRKLQNLFLEKKNKNNPEICRNCVFYNSNEMYNMPSKKDCSYCGHKEKYTTSHNSCQSFTEEMYEAKPNSTSTPELSLDLDLTLDTLKKID